MIHFNQLEITDDSKYLIVDAAIDDGKYFTDMYLDAIVIDTQDTFILNGPSSKPIYSKKFNEDTKAVYVKDFNNVYSRVLEDENNSQVYIQLIQDNKQKRVRLYISAEELGVDLSKTMLFVYIIAGGTPAPDTPCTYDVNKILGTVVNLLPIYRSFMPMLRELGDTCNFPMNLTNAILQLFGIRLAIKTGHYPIAIKLWKKFFGLFNSIPVTGVIKSCGCHG